MTDQRPECVYGVLVRDHEVFLALYPIDGGAASGWGLPGGAFRPMAEDRKVELRAYLWDQLGITVRQGAVWAQGAFRYRHPAEPGERFSGFYSVWEWDGEPRPGAGAWFSIDDLPTHAPGLTASLRILLVSIIETTALRTTG